MFRLFVYELEVWARKGEGTLKWGLVRTGYRDVKVPEIVFMRTCGDARDRFGHETLRFLKGVRGACVEWFKSTLIIRFGSATMSLRRLKFLGFLLSVFRRMKQNDE